MHSIFVQTYIEKYSEDSVGEVHPLTPPASGYVSVTTAVNEGRSCSSGRSQSSSDEPTRRGFLRSPNWPGEYPAGVDCEWTVSAERGRHILLVVSHAQLAADAEATNCSATTDSSTRGDWLLITETAGDDSGVNLGRGVLGVDRPPKKIKMDFCHSGESGLDLNFIRMM